MLFMMKILCVYKEKKFFDAFCLIKYHLQYFTQLQLAAWELSYADKFVDN